MGISSNALKTRGLSLSLSPFASVSEPDDLLWRSGYFLAAEFIAPCWLRVTLRPDEKTDAATADAFAAADDSKVSFRTTGARELLRMELQLSAGKGSRVIRSTKNKNKKQSRFYWKIAS